MYITSKKTLMHLSNNYNLRTNGHPSLLGSFHRQDKFYISVTEKRHNELKSYIKNNRLLIEVREYQNISDKNRQIIYNRYFLNVDSLHKSRGIRKYNKNGKHTYRYRVSYSEKTPLDIQSRTQCINNIYYVNREVS